MTDAELNIKRVSFLWNELRAVVYQWLGALSSKIRLLPLSSTAIDTKSAPTLRAAQRVLLQRCHALQSQAASIHDHVKLHVTRDENEMERPDHGRGAQRDKE